MAVCRQDRAYKDFTSNPIPTSSIFHVSYPSAGYTVRLLGTAMMLKKKRCRDGVTYLCSLLRVQRSRINIVRGLGTRLGLLRFARSRVEKVRTFW